MKIVLLGPPGAGKGTQSKVIAEMFNIVHISTGDLFRDNIKNETPLGRLVQDYMSSGQLVPDEVVISMVAERLKDDDCKGGYLLDGFPRTVAQAEALCSIHVNTYNTTLDYAINLDVPEEILVDRIKGRRVCAKCGRSYHVEYHKPQVDGICDFDGGDLIHRPDDTEAIVKDRIEIYNKETAPLVHYYAYKGRILNINGYQTQELVSKEIKRKIKGK